MELGREEMVVFSGSVDVGAMADFSFIVSEDDEAVDRAIVFGLLG